MGDFTGHPNYPNFGVEVGVEVGVVVLAHGSFPSKIATVIASGKATSCIKIGWPLSVARYKNR